MDAANTDNRNVRPGFCWPSRASWGEARQAFGAALTVFRSEVQSAEDHLAADPEAEPDASVDQMAIWKRVGREGAPEQVRANAWLLLAWGCWCVKAEEPALLWIGGIAAGLLTLTAVYPAVRWTVALAMRAFAP